MAKKPDKTASEEKKRAEKKVRKAAEKEAKKATKLVAKAAIASVHVETLDVGKSPTASYDPVARALTLKLPMPPPGPKGDHGPQGAQGPQGPQGAQGIQGPRGETGTGLDLRGAPNDKVARELYVDSEGRLCFRAGTRHFLVALTPKE